MNQSFGISFMSIFLLFAIVLISGLFWFRKYTGLSGDKAFLALLASMMPGGIWIIRTGGTPRPIINHESEVQFVISNLAACFLFVLLTAFVLRLWGRWIGEKATAEERLPGQPGVRAWFCTSNVIVGLLIVVCAWLGHDISPFFSALGIAAVLATYPLISIKSPAIAPAPAPESMSGEPEKIVAMLEAGKITADECAELLQALTETSRSPSRQVPLTSGQRLMLIGAALVAVGFFLPWFVINPGKEAGHLLQQMQSSVFGSVSQQVSSIPLPPGFPPSVTTGDISISGGDIQRGLGWAALALALSAALIPYIATSLDAATARTVRLLCLGIGGIIVLYLLTQNIRFVGIGLVIAVSGYALEVVGMLRERSVPSA